MYTIQANPSGTRSLEVSEENLATIEKYGLFRHLIDSNGIVDETVLDKLKLNIRSLIAAQEEDSKDLLDLCIDVIYHNNMKAFGLQQLIKLYLQWLYPTRHYRNRRRINENHRYLRTTALQPSNPCHKSHVQGRERREAGNHHGQRHCLQ